MQEQEFLEAKIKDAEKKRRETEETQRQIDEAKQKKIEEENKKIKMEKELKDKIASIPAEPEKNDTTTCNIAFRFPSGERLIRRFPKTAKIQVKNK